MMLQESAQQQSIAGRCCFLVFCGLDNAFVGCAGDTALKVW